MTMNFIIEVCNFMYSIIFVTITFNVESYKPNILL